MVKFIGSLFVSIGLILLWILTYHTGGYPGQGQLYFQTAPWWHIGLHVAWVLSVGVTAVYATYWYWDNRSRRKELTHQPPYQAHH